MRLNTLAGAALALIAAPAFAQSSVTVYGVIDLGLLHIENTSSGIGYLPKATAPRGTDNKVKDGGMGGSNFGLRGREDLGGGLAATFQLQGNINPANGTTGGPNSSSTNSFFNQYSTVGLAGSFGEIKFGRQVSPLFFAMAATDARGGRYFGSALTGLVALNSASGAFIGNNSNPAFGTIYNDNAIVYNSPDLGGLQFSAGYAMGEGKGRENSQQMLSAIYTNGGLKLSGVLYNGYGNNLPVATAVYTQALGNPTAGAQAAAAAGFSANANTNRLALLGALYRWSDYTISAQYFVARNPAKAILPGGSYSLNMWDVGTGWRVTPQWNLSAGYYRISDRTNSGNNASQLVLGAEYSASKRTTFYVEGARVTNDGKNMNFSPIYATPVAANHDTNAFMAGIRHAF